MPSPRGAKVLLLAIVCVCSAGCGSSRAAHVQATPALSVEDQSLAIHVDGLKADEEVTLDLRSTDARHVVFSARDAYRADRHGHLDLATAEPLPNGSYTGVWPMGLLTSMMPMKAPAFYDYIWGDGARSFVLTVSADGQQLATTTFARRVRIGDYRDVSLSVAKNGIDGHYSAPAGANRRPAVLLLGGSEGGNPGWGFPQQFAAHGLPTLQVGYFHGTGLPDKLVNIQLEYFQRALQWLSRQPQVDPRRITVVGISYGSEAALLLGVHYPQLVAQVAALVPSSVVTCGILGANRTAPLGQSCLGSPWSLNRKPLPHTALINTPNAWDQPKAIIPVEHIRGQVFLVCGGADEEWSSCPYAAAIVTRRKHASETTRLFAFPDATHAVGTPDVDEPGILASLISPATEIDRERYYPALLKFLGAS